MLASVASVGDAYGNALAESFVNSFKTELIADRVWRTGSQLELAILEYIGWFNHARRHEALGDKPRAEMEGLYALRCETNISLKMKRGSQLNPVSVKARSGSYHRERILRLRRLVGRHVAEPCDPRRRVRLSRHRRDVTYAAPLVRTVASRERPKHSPTRTAQRKS